jgi:DNA repair photolyase
MINAMDAVPDDQHKTLCNNRLGGLCSGRPSSASAPAGPGTGRQRAQRTPAHRFRGRGAGLNPPNRFDAIHTADPATDADAPWVCDVGQPDGSTVRTTVYPDHARKLINRVDSPDLAFNWTINPYRGCEHGCIYCYARPFHEMLSFSCGVDFETKLTAKFDAPELLRRELAQQDWTGEPIVLSGITDCYQPIESKLLITRGCLEVLAECRQATRIATKSRLILRDMDVLQQLAAHQAVQVAVSITTLDNQLAARLEPRAASPADRLWVVRRLASAGIPVTVLVAPVIPGLTDHEMPAILDAAADAGAATAHYELLRLPHQVADLFDDWLKRHFPQRSRRILKLVNTCRAGRLYDSRWHLRMTGQGPVAEHLARSFALFARRAGLAPHGLDQSPPALNTEAFRRPPGSNQMMLFAS